MAVPNLHVRDAERGRSLSDYWPLISLVRYFLSRRIVAEALVHHSVELRYFIQVDLPSFLLTHLKRFSS